MVNLAGGRALYRQSADFVCARLNSLAGRRADVSRRNSINHRRPCFCSPPSAIFSPPISPFISSSQISPPRRASSSRARAQSDAVFCDQESKSIYLLFVCLFFFRIIFNLFRQSPDSRLVRFDSDSFEDQKRRKEFWSVFGSLVEPFRPSKSQHRQ